MNGRMKTLKTMRNKLLLATAAMACLMTVGLSAKENLKIDSLQGEIVPIGGCSVEK